MKRLSKKFINKQKIKLTQERKKEKMNRGHTDNKIQKIE